MHTQDLGLTSGLLVASQKFGGTVEKILFGFVVSPAANRYVFSESQLSLLGQMCAQNGTQADIHIDADSRVVSVSRFAKLATMSGVQRAVRQLGLELEAVGLKAETTVLLPKQEEVAKALGIKLA
jgi:hypothetical protein